MQLIFNFVLKIFLLLLPLFTFATYEVTLARGLFFASGSLILFILSLHMNPRRQLNNCWLMLFALIMFFHVFFNTTFGPESWFNFWYSMAGFFYVLCAILLFRSVYCHVDNVKQFFVPIVWVCILNLILVLSQYIKQDFFWVSMHRFNPICGFFNLPQQLGQYSALSVPTLYYIHPLLSLIPIISIILSKEVSAFVALFMGILFYLFFINKKRLAVLFLVCFILLGVMFKTHVYQKWYTRPVMWKKTITYILKKPFMGYGYQSFSDIVVGNMDKIGNRQNPGAFNDYLHTAQEFGIPTLVVLFMFFKEYFIRFIKKRGKSKLLIILGTNVFIGLSNMAGQGLIRYASVAGTLIILLALFFIQLEKETEG